MISSSTTTTTSISITGIRIMISTPSSHSKISRHKTFAKGWVAKKLRLIGSLTAALKCSKGWVRKDANLGLRTGCNSGGLGYLPFAWGGAEVRVMECIMYRERDGYMYMYIYIYIHTPHIYIYIYNLSIPVAIPPR